MAISMPEVSVPEGALVDIHIHITSRVNITAPAAAQKINRYLTMEVGNLLCAGKPQLEVGDRLLWRVPILVGTARRGMAGPVGEIYLDAETGEVLTDRMTPVEVLEAGAHRLLERPAL